MLGTNTSPYWTKEIIKCSESGSGGLHCLLYLFPNFKVYTAELFPTVIRNTAIGSCSTVARIGAILALLIGLLGGSIPMLILGVSAVVGGILALFFPGFRCH